MSNNFLESFNEIALLMKLYGNTLTKKQMLYLEAYYSNNLTYQEIADKYKISRNAILLMNKKSILILKKYEKDIGLLKKIKVGLKKAASNKEREFLLDLFFLD